MKDKLILDDNALYFLPLGGSEEFGVNFNLYHHAGKWLAIDLGIGFADERFPGVDIMLPDPAFIEARRKDLLGLIVTHAHEDHVGAVAHLWPRLKCPVYCTRFTEKVLKRKLGELGLDKKVPVHIVEPGDTVDLGAFSMGFVHVAHSIIETVAVTIETPAGNVFHSGDWNMDPTPVLSGPCDEKAIKAFGKKGVLAYVGDSTNSNIPGRTASEKGVYDGLLEVFKECKGAIGITTFASNIGRIWNIAKAAEACGRHVALVGRSLMTMTAAARDCGYLEDVKPFLDSKDMGDLSREKVVYIMTGSQGEARAALPRIARDDHWVKFGKGDTVIFSCRAIPGNEKSINHVKNQLAAAKINVVAPEKNGPLLHVSGHPCQDEVKDMYDWLKPQIVVPVHGERTQLEAQGRLAEAHGIQDVIVPHNGSLIKLAPGVPEVVYHVKTGTLVVEPNRIIDAEHAAVTERRKLQFSGTVHATVVLDMAGRLVADPMVSTFGLCDDDDRRLEEDMEDEIEDILVDIEGDDRASDPTITEEVRVGLRRLAHDVLGFKPKVSVHVIRV